MTYPSFPVWVICLWDSDPNTTNQFKIYAYVNTQNFRLISVHEVQAGEPEYLEQPSRTDISKHLKEDSVQAINKALAEQEDRGPEAIMDMVRIFWSLKYFCFYFASRNGPVATKTGCV